MISNIAPINSKIRFHFNLGTVTVECDFHTNGPDFPVTLIHHDLPAVTSVRGYEYAGSWIHSLDYDRIGSRHMNILKVCGNNM